MAVSSATSSSFPEVSKEQFLRFVGSRDPFASDDIDRRVKECWCQQLLSLQQDNVFKDDFLLLGFSDSENTLEKFHKLACIVSRILGNLPDEHTKEFHDASERKLRRRLSRTFSHLKLSSNNGNGGPSEKLSRFDLLGVLMNKEKFNRVIEVSYFYSITAPFDGVKNRFTCPTGIPLEEQAEVVDSYLGSDGARITVLDCHKLKLPFFPSQLCMTYLQELYLGGNTIAALPHAFRVFQDLKILALDDNLLSDLPVEIEQCTQLGCLSLSKNSFTDLPESLWQLGSLRILDLSYNQIEDLSRIGELPNLEILNVAHNRIKALPDGVGQLKRLVRLDVSGNELTTLSEAINGLDSIKYLYVHGNDIASIPLLDQSCPHLEDVSVSKPEVIEAIASRASVTNIWIVGDSVTGRLVESCSRLGTTLSEGAPVEVSFGEQLHQKRKYS
jgi:Leucine-rich repeat (LRR) protein